MLILRLRPSFMIQKGEIEFEVRPSFTFGRCVIEVEFQVSACKAALLRLRSEVQRKKNPNS